MVGERDRRRRIQKEKGTLEVHAWHEIGPFVVVYWVHRGSQYTQERGTTWGGFLKEPNMLIAYLYL